MADLAYQLAGRTATAITLTMATLADGYSKKFIASANNNGAATTINGKPLYKPNTTAAPTLIAGKAYTVWYHLATNRFFIKASAEGTATTAQVLAGVPFSNETDTGLVGTMPNRGSFNLLAGASVPAGYYSGGTAPTGKCIVTGTITSAGKVVNVSSLAFMPSVVILDWVLYSANYRKVFRVNAANNNDVGYWRDPASINMGADGIFPWTISENGFSTEIAGTGNMPVTYTAIE